KTESVAVSWHQVDISGLSTGTSYDYRVLNGSMQQISGLSGTFKTAPSSTTPFNFIVWGDNRSNPSVHQDVCDEASVYPADIAITVGDTLGSAYNSYSTEFYNPAKSFLKNVPFFACPGNHEYKADAGIQLPRLKAFLNQPTIAAPTQSAQQYFAFT